MPSSRGLVLGQFVCELLRPAGEPQIAIKEDQEMVLFEGNERELVHPLKDNELHRQLASVTDAKSTLKMASRYGFLKDVVPDWPIDGEASLSDVPLYEPVAEWLAWAKNFRHLITVFDAVKRQENWLAECVVWKTTPELVMWSSTGGEHEGLLRRLKVISHEFQPVTPVHHRWKRDKVFEPALIYIFQEVNDLLGKHVHPAVVPYVGDGDLRLSTHSLLGAAVATLAFELSGRRKSATSCKNCGDMFIPSRNGHQFHDDACRKAYSRRND